MLDATLKQQLQTYLERLTQPVEIVATLDDSDAAQEMGELLGEIAALSRLITLEQREPDGSVRVPSFSVSRAGARMGIRFAGLPMGHEFTSLVLALLQVGGHPPKVQPELLEQVGELQQLVGDGLVVPVVHRVDPGRRVATPARIPILW